MNPIYINTDIISSICSIIVFYTKMYYEKESINVKISILKNFKGGGVNLNNYLTKESINKLQSEIDHRKSVTRREINQDLKEARAQGDLSDNFEYKSAKRDRAHNEGRMHYLESMILTATIIEDTTNDDEVGLGKKVLLKFSDKDIEEFDIVTTIDADPIKNMISIESPLGEAIYKHKVGEEISIISPQGKYTVKIEKITLT